MINKCPTCKIELSTKFTGDAKISYCSECGFERAIIPEDNTIQGTLILRKQT